MAKAKKTTDETTPAAAEGTEAKKTAAPKKKAAAPKAAAAAAADKPEGAAAKAEAPAKKAPAKKPAAAAKPAPSPAGFGFGIDTNLAAQAAAKMLLNRSAGATNTGGGTVKHLKESLNKPAAPTLGNLLGGGPAGGGKASNLPHFSNQQKGQNQSTGHVGNTGVPRRTPG